MKAVFRWVVSAAVVLSPSSFATTALALDVQELAASADSVVQAKVQRVSSRWTKDGGRIVTDIEVEVVDRWKGDAANTLVVTQPGGVVGDVGQRVDGLAVFSPGEELVLFLEAQGPRFAVAGMAQGRFKVERSADGTTVAVRQDQCETLHLIDRATRQAVLHAPIAMSLAALKRSVSLAAKAQPKRPAGAQVAP